MQTRLEREQELHDRTFGEDGRAAASKFYEADRPGVDRYREPLLRFGSSRRVLEFGCRPGSSAFTLVHHLGLAATYREVARVLERDGHAGFFEPLGHNPAINACRRRTPGPRTVDEHPLRVGDLELAGEHFGSVEVEYFNLLTLLAVPACGTRVFHPLLGTLHRTDQALFRRVGTSRKHAWMALLSLGAPQAGAPA